MGQGSSPSFKWWIASVLCLSQISVGCSITAVTIAIPSMMASLGASLNQIQWVLTGFLITRTVMMPLAGSLGSQMSDRSFFMLCTGVFTAGSFLCAIAWNAESLSVFRIIQAIGAGPLVAVSMAIMFETFPPHQRGLAMGIFSASWSIAPYVGPPLGGLVVELLDWTIIFYANAFAGLLTILGAYLLFSREKPKKKIQSFDLLGFLSFSGGMIALLVVISRGQEFGWASPLILCSIGVSLLLLIFFVALELNVQNPFMEIRYLRSMTFSVVNLLNFFRVFCFRGASFLISLVLQMGLNYTPFQAGMFLLPGIFLTAATAPIAGVLSDRLGARAPVIIGFGIMMLSAYGLSTLTIWTGVILIFLFISMQSIGQACVNAPLNTTGLRSSPEGTSKMASGMLSMSRSLGESFGVAALSVLLERRTFINLSHMVPVQDPYLSEGLRFKTLSGLHHLLLHSGEAVVRLERRAYSFLSYTLFGEALIISYQDSFRLIALFYLLMFVSSLFLPSFRKAKTATTAA